MIGSGYTHLSKLVGEDADGAILSFRGKTPITAPDGTNFWLTTRVGPVPVVVAGPEKGSKEWKEAEKKKKKQEKEEAKRLKKVRLLETTPLATACTHPKASLAGSTATPGGVAARSPAAPAQGAVSLHRTNLYSTRV